MYVCGSINRSIECSFLQDLPSSSAHEKKGTTTNIPSKISHFPFLIRFNDLKPIILTSFILKLNYNRNKPQFHSQYHLSETEKKIKKKTTKNSSK